METELPVIDVRAWRRGAIWRYTYVEQCPWCPQRHVHGGGDGERPDGQLGAVLRSWVTHCTRAGTAPMVALRLVAIEEPKRRLEGVQ